MFKPQSVSSAAAARDQPSPNIDDATAELSDRHTVLWTARDSTSDENESVVTPALVRIAVVAGLGGLMFGFDTGIVLATVSAPRLPDAPDRTVFAGVVSGALLVIGSDLSGDDNPGRPLSAMQESWLVSSALVGAFAGSLVAAKGADRFGRRPVILAAAVLFVLGALEQAAAQVYKEVILGRILVGIGVGLSSSVLPIYLAELSPAKFRGRIVASLVVLITGGQVLAYVVDACFFSTSHGWRYMFGAGAVPAVVQLLMAISSLPESPRFHLSRGWTGPARETLKMIHPTLSSDAIQAKIDRIQAETAAAEHEGLLGLGHVGSLKDVKEGLMSKIWRDRASRRAVILACGLQFFQQATGFNGLMYYSARVLQLAHFTNPAAFAMVVAVSNFVCTIIALKLIDKLGRRPLLLRTLAGMLTGMIILAISFFFIPAPPKDGKALPGGPSAAAFVALLGMVIFCSSYALGLGNVPWVLQSEVFTQELRATGTSLATATNWTANLIVAATYLHLTRLLSVGGTFLLFTFVIAAAIVFTFKLLPETKGLGLDETRALFEQIVGQSQISEGAESAARYVSIASEDEDSGNV
ncbi:hypothetical protein OIV83_004324 [Microbotryomycetes sp. JL201]|nr:hypothetical protein OIV83_004302 [Microbotryomycetes sp. JL201]KAK4049177.1 hypothetical protein OIV83_004324 [Microbotryomycetes sp. JL201]